MARPLSDRNAVRLCRTHQPSSRQISRIIDWALANPAPVKVAPMLVLFTGNWAGSQYTVLNGLYSAMTECASSDATPLRECVSGDFDLGRIAAANQILWRLGLPTVPAPSSSLSTTEDELAIFEARRSAWPAERDQLPITASRADISDEEARAICHAFKPTVARMWKAIDWALASPAPDKAAWLLILQTENYAFGHSFAGRMTAALKACAAIDAEPLHDWLERDYDEYRNWAAARALIALGSPEAVGRMMLRA